MENEITLAIGIMIMAVSVYYFFSKKPVTIYNQEKPPQIEQIRDVKLYNYATSLLMFIYGLIFILESFVFKENMFCLIFTFLTVMPGIVVVIYIYEVRILKKYIKKEK